MTIEQIKIAQELSKLSGIQVKDIRAAVGLEPLGDPSIDNIVLNVPIGPEPERVE